MKNIIAVLSVLLTMCCASCKDDSISAGGHEQTETGLQLSIALNGEFGMNSRSAMLSSEPLHHIEHMYAYVFANEAGAFNQDDATCIYEEKLPWTASANAVNVFRCKLDEDVINYEDPDKEYLVMVVAVDNNKDTYTFPWSGAGENGDIHLGMTGKELNQVKMELAAGVEASQMSYTEVFAGFRKFTTKESLINVRLTRRVAGVVCYLTDIPAKVSDYHIIGAELHWSGGLNKSGVLKPENIENDYESFAALTEDEKLDDGSATLLAKIDLKEMGAAPDEEEKLLYIPAINQEGVLSTLTNTALMGAYMLPIKTGGQFIIKLVGEKRNAEGNVEEGSEHVFTEEETDGYFKVNNSDGQSSYSIEADYVYNIGYKPYTTDTDYDAPLSLKGKPIVVEASEWHPIKVDVDFSNTQLGMVFDTGKTANFRYDCAATEDVMHVKVLSADFKDKSWTLSTTDDWLQFKNGDTWTTTITGTGERDITIKVSDYINQDSDKKNTPDDDFRTATVTLTIDDGSLTSTSYVRQWNALIVPTVDEDGDFLDNIAFRRLDNGAKFNPDGTVNYDNVKTYKWAEESCLPSLIFGLDDKNTGDDGLANYNSAVSALDWNRLDEHWAGCVLNLAKDGEWYLPARIELFALMRTYGDGNTASAFIDVNGVWWSATAARTDMNNRYYFHNDENRDRVNTLKNNNKWYDVKSEDFINSRELFCRARLAHKIP